MSRFDKALIVINLTLLFYAFMQLNAGSPRLDAFKFEKCPYPDRPKVMGHCDIAPPCVPGDVTVLPPDCYPPVHASSDDDSGASDEPGHGTATNQEPRPSYIPVRGLGK